MSVAGGVPFAKAIWLLAEPPLAEAARKDGSSSIVCEAVQRLACTMAGADPGRVEGTKLAVLTGN